MGKKILVLSGSPRKGGNSDYLCDRFIAGAQEAGHEAAKIFISGKKVGYCRACYACKNTGKCVQKDDMEEILAKMLAADVLVLASPVYFYSIDAQIKTVLDRTLARWTELGDHPYPADATTAQKWNPMYKSVPACCLSGGGVWWDPKRSKFRMWYLASWSGLLAIAESDDAVHWTRPNVGPRGTNVLIYPDHYFDTFSVWPDFTTDAPYDNWRMFVSPGENPCRAYEYASADGVKWELKTRTGLGGDSSTVFFNPFRRKWVWSIRAAWRLRSRMYREHDDFFAGAAWDFGSFTSEQKTGADPLFYRANRWSNTKDCYQWLACDYDDIPREIDGTRIHHGRPFQDHLGARQ